MSKLKKLVIVSLALCIGLGLVRAVIAGNDDHLFMPWNLFLALVPLLVALKFKSLERNKLWLAAFIWLLFLPNSFYVVTDIIHLNSAQVVKENIRGPFVSYDDVRYISIVFDALLLFTCSAISFLLGLESIRLFRSRFSTIISKLTMNIALFTTFFLSGIAIYLGRYVRLNSWDFVVKPWSIAMDILNLFIRPAEYTREWVVIVSFSVVAGVLYYIYQMFHDAIANTKK